MMRKLCAIVTTSHLAILLLATLAFISLAAGTPAVGQDATANDNADAAKTSNEAGDTESVDDSTEAEAKETEPADEKEEKNQADDASKSNTSSEKPAKQADKKPEEKSTSKETDDGDDDAKQAAESTSKSVETPKPVDTAGAQVTYPRWVETDGDDLFIVDLDLPGIWKLSDGKSTVFAPGTKLLRKPMNRPWCVIPHPDGGILVGDSATREIYAIADAGTKLTALTNGYIGIPMALAVSPDKKTIYVGDAEKRAVFQLPIGGGKPELVVRVNARGLDFDGDGNLWAVTPDADAVQKIDVAKKTATVVIKNRPYQFPCGITWAGDHGYVTDGYGKSIWKFTADGKTEPWLEGKPLTHPVGITSNDKSVFVADPKTKQVYEIDRETKKVTNRL